MFMENRGSVTEKLIIIAMRLCREKMTPDEDIPGTGEFGVIPGTDEFGVIPGTDGGQ